MTQEVATDQEEKLPLGWPEKEPIYDIAKSYLENAEKGPFFTDDIPKRVFPEEKKWIDFLGFKIASPLGIPAGPLLNSRWISVAAQLGFDVVTYKTIRSEEHPGHPVPNMTYIETSGFLDPQDEGKSLLKAKIPPLDLEKLAVTNSFGMPSRDSHFLIKDIAQAKASLVRGQVMIVSIVGTPRPSQDFALDFVKAALIAKEGGASIIEANFSCPNVASCEGSLYSDPCSVYHISSLLKKAIGEIPLVIKVGVIPNPKLLKDVMVAATKAGVLAICGINTLSMKIVTEDGSPALGENRLKSGVCGGPIRMAALDFIKKAFLINKEEKLGLTLLATGGVTKPEHFDLFLEAGAAVSMSATGMMWDPYLALRYHRRKKCS